RSGDGLGDAVQRLAQQEVDMDAIEGGGVLELGPMAAAVHDGEQRAGNHGGDAASLADVGGGVVGGPQHQGGRLDARVVFGADDVALAHLHFLKNHVVAHAFFHAVAAVHGLAGCHQVVVYLGFVGHQPFQPGAYELPAGVGGRAHGQFFDLGHDRRVGLRAAGRVEHQPIDAVGVVYGEARRHPATQRFAAETGFFDAGGIHEAQQVVDVVTYF